MKPRLAWMLCLVALSAPCTAWGQTPPAGQPAPAPSSAPPATGTLTVLSKPAGAAFRLSGEMRIVGRTPMVIDRVLSGKYEVSCIDPRYGGWSRRLSLSGAADTVWMTLSTRSAAGAGLRSLVLPGWGQFYDGHPHRGVLFLTTTAAAGGALAFCGLRYRDKRDAWGEALTRYYTIQTPQALAASEEARREVEKSRRLVQTMSGVLGGLWALNVIEAIVSVPRTGSDRVSLSATPVDPAGRASLTLTARF